MPETDAAAAPPAGDVDRPLPIGIIGLFAGAGLVLFGVLGSLIPGLKQSTGPDFLVFVACVGLAAVCGALGSQARLAAGPIVLVGSAGIAAAFFLIWKRLEPPPVEVLFGARLQVISPHKPKQGTIWIDQTEAVPAAELSQNGRTTTFSFALRQHQAEALERSICSRLEIEFADRSPEALEFDARHVVPAKFNQVANLWFDEGTESRFYQHRRGIREAINRKCPTGAALVEAKARMDEQVVTTAAIVRPASPPPSPNTPAVVVPAPAPPATQAAGILGWSYFGLKPSGEATFSEKNFDIVGRPAAVIPAKGDVLIALTDVRLRQGPRRFNPASNSWENDPVVGVLKAGEKVRIGADPVIANGVSYWISSKERVD